MEPYISKAALLAELNRKKIPFKRDVEDGNYPTYLCAIMDFEDYINSLEVKEVDLEDEIDKELDEEWYGEYIEHDKFRKSAKHFFELGLKAQKGE